MAGRCWTVLQVKVPISNEVIDDVCSPAPGYMGQHSLAVDEEEEEGGGGGVGSTGGGM